MSDRELLQALKETVADLERIIDEQRAELRAAYARIDDLLSEAAGNEPAEPGR